MSMKAPHQGAVKIVNSYKVDPKGTLKNVGSAIFECVPGSIESAIGQRFMANVIAPMYIMLADLRARGVEQEALGVQMKKWIVTNHPKLLTDVPDKDFLELLSYMKNIGDDDVERCMLRSVMQKTKADGFDAGPWKMRL